MTQYDRGVGGGPGEAKKVWHNKWTTPYWAMSCHQKQQLIVQRSRILKWIKNIDCNFRSYWPTLLFKPSQLKWNTIWTPPTQSSCKILAKLKKNISHCSAMFKGGLLASFLDTLAAILDNRILVHYVRLKLSTPQLNLNSTQKLGVTRKWLFTTHHTNSMSSISQLFLTR